ncbi:NUDIX hydrolase [Desulfospira joergensenii]|uniref:NUDIX hydrolase n=1 Tax=Desulfospira joergensenii TaxID=53329 RepID=UPI0003B2ED25|nr:NUDIX hydrolase [Desulfospira joergensenii]
MRITRVEKITDLKHLNLFSMEYRDRKEQEKTWVYASRKKIAPDPDRADAVVVVPFHVREEKLVVIKEFRVVLGGYQYGFPAGLVDPGEDLIQAGKRELFEETGLKLTRVLGKSPPVYSSSGMTDESVSLIHAECEGAPSSRFNEDSEDIEVMMLSREEAGSLIKEPGLKFDVKTWIILNTYASKGIL